MTKNKSINSIQFKFTQTRCVLVSKVFACFVLVYCLAIPAHAWVTLDMPDLTASLEHGGALSFSHLPDGRLIFGNNNALFVQNTFGLATMTSFATPPDVDPSFISVLNATTAIVGGGQFVATPVYQFNPSNPASPGYSSVTTLQNFSAAPAGTSGIYVAGGNDLNGNNSVTFVALGGTQVQIVDPVGEFSAGITVDAGGNLFVGDNDNSSVYEFTSSQVINAINHSLSLGLGDGTLVHTFDADVVGSLAVDGEGRIWATGFGAPGLFWFNPANNGTGVLDPENAAADPFGAYTLGTFTANNNDYVSFVWQSDFSQGSSVVYGYDLAQNVPEPANFGLVGALVVSTFALWGRCRKTKLLS